MLDKLSIPQALTLGGALSLVTLIGVESIEYALGNNQPKFFQEIVYNDGPNQDPDRTGWKINLSETGGYAQSIDLNNLDSTPRFWRGDNANEQYGNLMLRCHVYEREGTGKCIGDFD